MQGFKIALFGEPGSGKSAVVERVISKKPQIRWLEVSRDIIASELSKLHGSYEEKRSQGKEIFDNLSAVEGPNWSSRRVINAVEDSQHVIVTGVRGYSNFRHLSENGYCCVFVDCTSETSAERISKRNGVSRETARKIIEKEASDFETRSIKDECHFVINNGRTISAAEYQLFNICLSISSSTEPVAKSATCKTCVNSINNSSIYSSSEHECDACRAFRMSQPHSAHLKNEFDHIVSKISADNAHGRPILAGISGGKDSTVMLAQLSEIAKKTHAFTIDTGYYPISVLSRSKKVAHSLGCSHTVFDAREFLSDEIVSSYRKTAEFFETVAGQIGKDDYSETYNFTRKHYSIKENVSAPYPRPCVLCRRIVIRSYYELARQHGARFVFLGINEWVNLADTSRTGDFNVSGIRLLQPTPDSEPVYVVHWPFVAQTNLEINRNRLEILGWEPPYGEDLVEANANSCLLAKVTERDFARVMGFHPDSTRLAREVTAGFLPRSEALTALASVHRTLWSAREVLEYAKIL